MRSLLFVVNVAWFFLSHRAPIARAAMDAGFRVHLASDIEADSEVDEVRDLGIVFHRIRLVRGGKQPVRELTSLRDISRVVRTVRPEVVHNVTSKPVIYGSRAAREYKIRGVVNAISGFGHAYGEGLRRRMLRIALDRAYAQAFSPVNVRVLVQNSEDRAEVLRILPRAEDRVRVIPGSGVDLRKFLSATEPTGVPTVLLPARLLREKGILEFCEAAGKLRARGLCGRFLLAGRLDPENPCGLGRAQIDSLCASNGVEWIGDSRDMPRLMRSANIVCLPSYYREGVPKVLLEACAAGRAIVTTDTPGCRDVVRHAYNGLLVPPRDPEALGNAIARLLQDPATRMSMGAAGRLRAQQEFTVDKVIERHMEIYGELVESKVA